MRESPFSLAPHVESADLVHGPPQPSAKTSDDALQPIDKSIHVAAQFNWIDDIAVFLRPTLLEYPLDIGRERIAIARHEIPKFAEVEWRAADHAAFEEVGLDPMR